MNDDIYFLYADKYQGFLQVDAIILSVPEKRILHIFAIFSDKHGG